MNPSLEETVWQRMERVAQALEQNNMKGYCVKTRQEVISLLKQLIPEKATVAVGGSVTLDECGVLEFLREGNYEFWDRYAPGLTREEIEEVFRRSFWADCYLASANAITESGEIFNVDGNSNRVAAIAYGPASVILVVGSNKIVRDLTEAQTRLETFAAPANAKRLSCKTPCAVTGKCEHCHSPARICCTYTVQRFQRQPGRIKVILVQEPLGY